MTAPTPRRAVQILVVFATLAAPTMLLADSSSTQRFMERSYEVDRARELRNQRFDEDRAIRRTLVPPAPTTPPPVQRGPEAGWPPPEVNSYGRYSVLVSETQEALARLGYRPGAIDGILGPRTNAAVRAYQRDQGLAETGAPSAALLDRLRATTR